MGRQTHCPCVLILERLIRTCRSGVDRMSHSHEMRIINFMKKEEEAVQRELVYWDTMVNRDWNDLFIVSNEASTFTKGCTLY